MKQEEYKKRMLDDKKYNTHITAFDPAQTKKMAKTKLQKRLNILDKIEKDKKKEFNKRKKHKAKAAMHIYLERIEDYDPMDVKGEV